MVRITPTVLFGAILLGAAVGCAHFVESRAIKHFTAALEKEDLDQLKASTSETFEQKALRRDDSIDALKILKLHPERKVTIVKVDDVSENEKKVTVTVGDSNRKMLYKLYRDPKSGKWVVDDVVVRKDSKDVAAAKSVTEQMDLLLAVQDFLTASHGADRSAIAAVTTPAFGKLLSDLPQTHLTKLTRRIAGERIRSEEFRPEAQIDGNDAVVKLQRTKGVLILTMKQTGGGWKVADVKVESRKDKDQLASATETATVVRTVVDFLKAYQADDKDALKTLALPKFYEECLKIADLKLIPLPGPDTLGDADTIKTHASGGEYLIQHGEETVKLSLTRTSLKTDDAAAENYALDDVTIYDAKEEKRISALFTAQAKMQLFAEALQQGNRTLIRENSTADLSSKVWNLLGPVPIAEILPPEIELQRPEVVATDFHGPIVRIHVRQGSRELTYVMRVWSGEVNVDDVLMPVLDRPNSLKETLQSLLPIHLFAHALKEASLIADGQVRQLEVLKAVSGADFDRLVWSQLTQIPESVFVALPHLDPPVSAIKDTQTGQTVVLGDERFGSRIELVREKAALVIDRVWLVSGSHAEPLELKHMLKAQLATRGPRGLAFDPLSSKPVATDPQQTADATPDAVDHDGWNTAEPTPAGVTAPKAASSPPTFAIPMENPAPATTAAPHRGRGASLPSVSDPPRPRSYRRSAAVSGSEKKANAPAANDGQAIAK